MAKHDTINNEELRGQLDTAYQYMRDGNGTDAVKTLSTAFLFMLKLKPEILEETIEPRPGRKMPAVMRWPALGANIKLDSVMEKKPQIDFVRERFAVSEAMTYYEYTVDTARNHSV